MEEKITYNGQIKCIKQCKNYKELLKEIKNAFNLNNYSDVQIKIKTEEGNDDINEDDDFDNVVSDEYPPLIITVEGESKEMKETKEDNNQNIIQNSSILDSKLILDEIEKMIESKIIKKNSDSKIIVKMSKNMSDNNLKNESNFNEIQKKLENIENKLNRDNNESSEINEKNKKIEEYEKKLQDKDKIIHNLNLEIDKLNKELDEKCNNLSKLEAENYDSLNDIKKSIKTILVEMKENKQQLLQEKEDALHKKNIKLEEELKDFTIKHNKHLDFT